ncbi:MAG: ECF transporter S component [Candidatus Aphodosoma sp.]
METTVKFYSLGYSDVKTYLAALIFISGNIVVPQFFHLMPQGGVTWLPIYFFTLVGAYKYGWRVGLLTAVASPLANSLLFGMPLAAGLPAILLKSTLLAIFAGMAASYFKKATLWTLIIVVLAYQVVGTLGEWAMKGDFYLAVQDFRIGVPGMLLQLFGGWLFLNRLMPMVGNRQGL